MSYEEQHATLVAYLKVKAEQGDWHGVSDAANDLRVLEAEHSATQRQKHADAYTAAA